jgi:secondary thiamine-phosphate synthase enzyme
MASPVTLIHADELTIATDGRGTIDITRELQGVVSESGIRSGLLNLFIAHTSASLIVCENADPTVRSDLERFASLLVPDGMSIFEHTAEGPDDMSAHVRSVLTQTSLSIPIAAGRCALGTWQGVYLWEHRTSAHRRRVRVTALGTN